MECSGVGGGDLGLRNGGGVVVAIVMVVVVGVGVVGMDGLVVGEEGGCGER